MKRTWTMVTIPLASLVFANACATRGALREVEESVATHRAEVDAALETERSARIAADEQLSADLQALRSDLDALRSDFDARIVAVENGLQFALPVHFSYDDATVRPEDVAALNRFVDIIGTYYTGALVTVEGFADPAGSRSYNESLSERRAESVREHLMSQGIAAEVRSIGYGEDRLVVPDAAKNDPGAEMNRRVVFVVESPGRTSATDITLLNIES